MSENEDKARKLKEIQDRLSEIQKKSSTSKQSSEESESKKKKENELSPPPLKEKKKEGAEKIKNPIISKAPKPAATSKPEKVLTQEEKNWQANRLKDKNKTSPKEKGPAIKKEGHTFKKKSSLSKIYTLISLVVTLVVCSYFFYAFFLSPKENTEETIESAIPEIIEEKTPDEIESQNEKQSSEEEIKSEIIEEDEVTDAEAVEITVTEEELPVRIEEAEPIVVPPVEAKSIPPVEAKVPSGLIISYASNSTKKIALKNVSYLKGKGFDAGYYYMPDKNPDSPSLYKVYVGPYKDESGAMPDFRKIVDLNDKAFILRMN